MITQPEKQFFLHKLLHSQQLKDNCYELTTSKRFASIFLIPTIPSCNQLILARSSSTACLFPTKSFVKCLKNLQVHVRVRKDLIIAAVVRGKNKPLWKAVKIMAVFLLLDFENFKTNLISSC